MLMVDSEKNCVISAQATKRVVRDLIDVVWTHGCFDDLSRFWSADCINHADPSPDTKGLVALRRYHAQFAQVFASFSDVSVDVLQQTAEDDRVVTEMITSAKNRSEEHTSELQSLMRSTYAV